jgi:hypothetical protein
MSELTNDTRVLKVLLLLQKTPKKPGDQETLQHKQEELVQKSCSVGQIGVQISYKKVLAWLIKGVPIYIRKSGYFWADLDLVRNKAIAAKEMENGEHFERENGTLNYHL